jgi:hypothetical protein
MMRFGSSLFFTAQEQGAGYELEAIEFTTSAVGGCEGLEGGFITFDQHALMLSTIVRLVGYLPIHFKHRFVSRDCAQQLIY